MGNPVYGPTNQSALQRALGAMGGFANSAGGAAAIQGIGSLLSAQEEKRRQDDLLNRQQGFSANQSKASILQRQAEADQADERSRSEAALAANPLGSTTNFAARQAMMAAILPQLRNASFTPGDPAVAAAMPHISGGLTLPDGGLPPSALAAFSPEATSREIANRTNAISRVDPKSAGNYGTLDSLGLGVNAAGLEGENQSFRAEQLQNQNDASTQNRLAIMRALDNDPTGAAQAGGAQQQAAPPAGYEYDKNGQLKKKGGGISGFFKGLGKAALVAAPFVAAPFTGGASLMASGMANNLAGKIK